MKTPRFCYSINTDCIYGTDRVSREIYISIEDHPHFDNAAFERLNADEVKTLRDMCDQILKEVKNDEEKHREAGNE